MNGPPPSKKYLNSISMTSHIPQQLQHQPRDLPRGRPRVRYALRRENPGRRSSLRLEGRCQLPLARVLGGQPVQGQSRPVRCYPGHGASSHIDGVVVVIFRCALDKVKVEENHSEIGAVTQLCLRSWIMPLNFQTDGIVLKS